MFASLLLGSLFDRPLDTWSVDLRTDNERDPDMTTRKGSTSPLAQTRIWDGELIGLAILLVLIISGSLC